MPSRSNTCPRCGSALPRPSAQRDVFGPGDEHELITWKTFAAPCPSCGAPLLRGRPVVYENAQRGGIIRFTPRGDAPKHAEPSRSGMALRDTNDLVDFREKIVLLRAGYDDRIVELVKLLCTVPGDDEGEGITVSDPVVVEAYPDFLLVSAWDESGHAVEFRSPRGLYERVRDEVPPEVLATDGFVMVDREWALSRVRPTQAK